MTLHRFILLCIAAALAATPEASAGAHPLEADAVLFLVTEHAPAGTIWGLVKKYGIVVKPEKVYLDTLRAAGAQEVLLRALQGIAEANELRSLEASASKLCWVDAGDGAFVAPKPVHFPYPRYTHEAGASKVTGTVVLCLDLDVQGRVTGVKRLQQPLGGGLDEQSVKRVQDWKFEPAIRDGGPMSCHVIVEIDFYRH